jgi:hypothetical protein
MKNEINKDFYCSAERYDNLFCRGSGATCDANRSCNAYHRKHPTPEQYKEEYGGEYPDDGAVYVLKSNLRGGSEWCVVAYFTAKREGYKPIVCACTPFGCPDDNWRPQ